MNKKRIAELEKLLLAVKRHCLECSGGSYKERDNCHIEDCNLHLFRYGIPTEE